jgi:hypothetical protein
MQLCHRPIYYITKYVPYATTISSILNQIHLHFLLYIHVYVHNYYSKTFSTRCKNVGGI